MFPAYAGMIRMMTKWITKRLCVPRLRGDDPAVIRDLNKQVKCSPPTRG